MKVYLVICEQDENEDYNTWIEYASLDETKAHRYAEDYFETYKKNQSLFKSIDAEMNAINRFGVDFDELMSEEERILNKYNVSPEFYETRWTKIEDVRVEEKELD